MENSQVAQKINTIVGHVVPKNQIFSDMFSIFKDRLKLGGKKTVINFFGLMPKKIMPRCRALFSMHFCNSSKNSISSLSRSKIGLKFLF
jgi:aromatic ring-cleaving dioxygenase